jgi:dolichyl-phosphate-mannose-protein mannosyltransferase
MADLSTTLEPRATQDAPSRSRVSWERLAFWAALVLAFGGGAFLRLWKINALGFNTDEAVYAGQAAGIAHDPVLEPYFPVFRAHPLLFQTFLGIFYQFGTNDLLGRLISAAIGVATIYVVYRLGHLLYGRRAGVIAALIFAFMPYHVVVSRQVLLDGPETLFATLTLYCVARYAASSNSRWFYAAGASMGLTVISKESAILLLGAIYAFFALTPSIRLRLKDFAISAAIMVAIILPYPLALTLGGKPKSGGEYLSWQLFRRPNHSLSFYPTEVPIAMGVGVILAAIVGLWLLRHQGSWRETLLLCWILVPGIFFELWPVKGFQYLLPTAAAVTVLAARMLGRWSPSGDLRLGRFRMPALWVGPAIAGVVALSILLPSWDRIQPSNSDTFLAGSGGVPGGREMGGWIKEHVPVGSQFLALGPSMANLVQFYGHRRAFGLSVSPNPLHRNPSYEPVLNPDLKIRQNELQYIVWDAFSAARSEFFSKGLIKLVRNYNGRVVYTYTVKIDTDQGEVRKPVLIIYTVRPNNGQPARPGIVKAGA